MLGAAYALLVVVVAWLSWDLDRRAQETQVTVCVAAFANATVVLDLVEGIGVPVPDETTLQIAELLDLLVTICEPVADVVPRGVEVSADVS